MIDPPAFAPRDPDFETRVRRSFERQGFMALLGAELARVEAGVVAVTLPVINYISFRLWVYGPETLQEET